TTLVYCMHSFYRRMVTLAAPLWKRSVSLFSTYFLLHL
ncbi:hypothetical protein V3C99_008354, partial [Haemonchus contortus]